MCTFLPDVGQSLLSGLKGNRGIVAGRVHLDRLTQWALSTGNLGALKTFYSYTWRIYLSPKKNAEGALASFGPAALLGLFTENDGPSEAWEISNFILVLVPGSTFGGLTCTSMCLAPNQCGTAVCGDRTGGHEDTLFGTHFRISCHSATVCRTDRTGEVGRLDESRPLPAFTSSVWRGSTLPRHYENGHENATMDGCLSLGQIPIRSDPWSHIPRRRG